MPAARRGIEAARDEGGFARAAGARGEEPLHGHRELLTGWLLLLLDGGAGHGYEMRSRLDGERVRVDRAVVYRMLRRLEADGCLDSTWTDSRAGPRRREYRLTPRGRAALRDSVALVAELRDLHDRFLRAADHLRGGAPDEARPVASGRALAPHPR